MYCLLLSLTLVLALVVVKFYISTIFDSTNYFNLFSNVLFWDIYLLAIASPVVPLTKFEFILWHLPEAPNLVESAQIQPLQSQIPLLDQPPTTPKFLCTLMNILVAFAISIVYINPLHQLQTSRPTLSSNTCTMGSIHQDTICEVSFQTTGQRTNHGFYDVLKGKLTASNFV